jgi:membrane protein DedA with SNARE-associated domain
MGAGWAHMVASAPTSSNIGSTWWEYVLLFLAVVASWAGVPAIGSAAVAAAAVGASQGNLNLPAVLAVSAIAGEVGGLSGYYIGHHWGSQILARPGKRQAGRQQLLDKGERAYAKWGRLAVFFTPAIISGTARMKLSQFALWNFLASIGFSLSVAATAYGVCRVTTGHRSTEDIVILILGLTMSAILIFVFVRRHRRHRSHATSGETGHLTTHGGAPHPGGSSTGYT